MASSPRGICVNSYHNQSGFTVVAVNTTLFAAQNAAKVIATSATEADTLIHAPLAHLWLVTLHPFDDGNGRISRAVGDVALVRA